MHIHKLKLRLRGVDEPTAWAVVAGLGAAIAGGLDVGGLMQGGSRSIDSINLGTLPMASGAAAGALRGKVASSINTELTSPLPPTMPTGIRE